MIKVGYFCNRCFNAPQGQAKVKTFLDGSPTMRTDAEVKTTPCKHTAPQPILLVKRGGKWKNVREMPLARIPLNDEYQRCRANPCRHGDTRCSYAHSEHEQAWWNAMQALGVFDSPEAVFRAMEDNEQLYGDNGLQQSQEEDAAAPTRPQEPIDILVEMFPQKSREFLKAILQSKKTVEAAVVTLTGGSSSTAGSSPGPRAGPKPAQFYHPNASHPNSSAGASANAGTERGSHSSASSNASASANASSQSHASTWAGGVPFSSHTRGNFVPTFYPEQQQQQQHERLAEQYEEQQQGKQKQEEYREQAVHFAPMQPMPRPLLTEDDDAAVIKAATAILLSKNESSNRQGSAQSGPRPPNLALSSQFPSLSETVPSRPPQWGSNAMNAPMYTLHTEVISHQPPPMYLDPETEFPALGAEGSGDSRERSAWADKERERAKYAPGISLVDKLRLEKLYDELYWINRHDVASVFIHVCGFDAALTSRTLLSKCGGPTPVQIEERRAYLAEKKREDDRIRNQRLAQKRQEQRSAPQGEASVNDVAWMPTGDSLLHVYKELREEARALFKLRANAFEQAAKAARAGDGPAARELSRQARAYGEQMKAKHRAASDEIFRHRNPHLSSLSSSESVILDLHGLHSKEATEEVLPYYVDLLRSMGVNHARVVTGTGHHTRVTTAEKEGRILDTQVEGNMGKLEGKVKEWLVERGIQHSQVYDHNGRSGVFLITV